MVESNTADRQRGQGNRWSWFISLATACLVGWYGVSGITIIHPHEVAITTRLGELRRGAEGQILIHQPGLLFAWPAPFDQVIRIPIRQEHEVESVFSDASEIELTSTPPGSPALVVETQSASKQNWVITGDHQAITISARAKYRIEDAVAFATASEDPHQFARCALAAAITQVLSTWTTSEALRLSQDDEDTVLLADAIASSAQRRVDRLPIGIRFSSVELVSVQPPQVTVSAFEAVQSARIQQDTLLDRAKGDKTETLIAAEATAGELIADAKGKLSSRLADANAQAAPFLAALELAEQSSASSFRSQLYHDTWEHILASVRDLYLIAPNEGPLRLSVPALEDR